MTLSYVAGCPHSAYLLICCAYVDQQKNLCFQGTGSLSEYWGAHVSPVCPTDVSKIWDAERITKYISLRLKKKSFDETKCTHAFRFPEKDHKACTLHELHDQQQSTDLSHEKFSQYYTSGVSISNYILLNVSFLDLFFCLVLSHQQHL